MWRMMSGMRWKTQHKKKRKWEATEANKFAAISWEKAFSVIHCADGMEEDSGGWRMFLPFYMVWQFKTNVWDEKQQQQWQ